MKEANSESDNHCKNLRKRKAFLDYSEDNDLFEEHQVYDCCFIKVTGSIYGRWKRVRDQLKLQNDEDLVVHLLDFYQDLRDRSSTESGYHDPDLGQHGPLGSLDQDFDNDDKGIEISSDEHAIQDDKENWCFKCDQEHQDVQADCPFLNATELITDAIIDFSSKSNHNDDDNEPLVIIDNEQDLAKKKSFAELSLPSQFCISNEGSVLTTTVIASMTLLGPLQGEAILEKDITEDNDLKHLWLVQGKDKQRFWISTEDADKSNWLRYVKPAPSKEDKNLVIVYKEGSLYFVTSRALQVNEELLFWSDDPSITWTCMSGLSEKTNCGGCQFVSDHHLYYRLHLLLAHDPQLAKYHCKVCAMPFCDSENLIKHALNSHEGKGTFKCELCKKYFWRKHYLDMHRSYGCPVQSAPSSAKPACDLCGKVFCQPFKLRIHKEQVHGINETSRKPQQGSMNNDMLQDDNFTLRVICPKCSKTFKNKSNLKIHMLTHSGVKPFGCKVPSCNQGFTTKQCLQFHYKKHHGFSKETMPKIEREIPYTLSAYSGGIIDNVSTIIEKKIKTPTMLDSLPASGTSNESMNSDDVLLKPSCQQATSLLVSAALDAAEHDLQVDPQDSNLIDCQRVPTPQPYQSTMICGDSGMVQEEASILVEENPASIYKKDRYLPCAPMPSYSSRSAELFNNNDKQYHHHQWTALQQYNQYRFMNHF